MGIMNRTSSPSPPKRGSRAPIFLQSLHPSETAAARGIVDRQPDDRRGGLCYLGQLLDAHAARGWHSASAGSEQGAHPARSAATVTADAGGVVTLQPTSFLT